VTTNVLTGLFGISRGQASKDFAVYQSLAPRNLVYDRNAKAYLPSPRFKPRFMRGTSEEFLLLADVGASLGKSVVLPIAPALARLEVIRPPERKFDLHLLCSLNQAIRERRRFAVRYQSMTSPPRDLVLEPHTLVYNGFRWHVRAYSETHGEFRDFVLARFMRWEYLDDGSEHDAGDDAEWNERITLQVIPNPALTAHQREAIADDYGMEDGMLRLTVRKALSLYYMRMLNLDEERAEAAAKRPLVLVKGAARV
jgi:predicted DNA-binding transcriptional regulator YafY